MQDVCDILVAKNPGEKVAVSGLIINSTSDRDKILESFNLQMKVK